MSGYVAGILAVFSINLLLAYAVFLPAAAGMLNLGAAGFMAIGAYVSAYLDVQYGLPLPVCLLAGTLASTRWGENTSAKRVVLSAAALATVNW